MESPKNDPSANTVTLSPFMITGPPSSNMPKVVIMEMSTMLGVDVCEMSLNTEKQIQDALCLLERVAPNIVKYPLDVMDHQEIASFLNPHVDWDIDSLLEAMDFLIDNYYGYNCYHPVNIVAQLQTPMFPRALNACVLYKICTYNAIRTNRDNTINDLKECVAMISQTNTENKLRILPKLDKLGKVQMLRTYLDICCETRKNSIVVGRREVFASATYRGNNGIVVLPNTDNQDSQEGTNKNCTYNHNIDWCMLELYANNMLDISNMLRRIVPITHEEAICLAAYNEDIDISRAQDPLSEYARVIEMGSSYVPLDPYMLMEYNRDKFSIFSSHNFNPRLPQSVYSSDNLRVLAFMEGYTDRDLANNNPYELLQVAYLSCTFHKGVLSSSTNDVTLSLDKVDSYSNSELVSFGVRDVSTYVFALTELSDSFMSSFSYYNPIAKSPFPKVSITKLRLICTNKGASDTNASIEAKKELIRVMDKIDVFSSSSNIKVQELILLHENGSIEEKEKIETCLILLLHVGMYMRGWKGVKHEFPIKEAITPPDVINTVFLNVTKSIHDFECYVERNHMQEKIYVLPLMNWRGAFERSNTQEEGLTIKDRIDIVKEGEESTSMSSCIRLSSNRLCYSCHYYMCLLDMTPPFHLQSLAVIS